ncbi:MAG TPA: hypothetical protein VK363_08135 [Pyrinomonadaceae bacterium]|nr:hypothetical protein [Pyrinomonadaceae bacterium]
MKIPLLAVASLALLAFTFDFGSLAQEGEAGAPRFEDYRVAVRRGRVAPLDLGSHRLARHYRTLLREQQRDEGVNFAGHYTLASVGCGTGCSVTAIIDARTGRAYFPEELEGWTSIVGDYEFAEGEDVRMFRAGSRLLRAVGRPNIGRAREERHGPSGVYYYEWVNRRLRLVRFKSVGSYPEADPPEKR